MIEINAEYKVVCTPEEYKFLCTPEELEALKDEYYNKGLVKGAQTEYDLQPKVIAINAALSAAKEAGRKEGREEERESFKVIWNNGYKAAQDEALRQVDLFKTKVT